MVVDASLGIMGFMGTVRIMGKTRGVIGWQSVFARALSQWGRKCGVGLDRPLITETVLTAIFQNHGGISGDCQFSSFDLFFRSGIFDPLHKEQPGVVAHVKTQGHSHAVKVVKNVNAGRKEQFNIITVKPDITFIDAGLADAGESKINTVFIPNKFCLRLERKCGRPAPLPAA